MAGEPVSAPPHSIVAEKAVLGGILIENTALEVVRELIGPDDFYGSLHARIFRVMTDLADDCLPVDTVTVRELLKTRDQLSRETDSYLLDLTDTIPAIENIRAHALVIRERAKTRNLMAACQRIVANGYSDSRSSEELRGAMEKALEATKTAQADDVLILNTGELMEAAVSDYAAPQADRISPGLARWKAAIGFLPAGSLTVLAGNTGTGKSSVALELMAACAAEGTSSGLISLEDPQALTGGRLLAITSGVSSRLLQRGIVENTGWDVVNAAVVKGRQMGDLMQYANVIGGTELKVMRAMELMAARGARVLVVDYLTAVTSSRRCTDRRNEVNHVIIQLKAKAAQLGIALILISQIARPPGGNPNWKPTKHSLKETGDLENGAEVIVLLHREEEDDFAPVTVTVAKCKWGGTGQFWSMQRDKTSSDGHGSARMIEHGPAPVLKLPAKKKEEIVYNGSPVPLRLVE